MDLNNYRLALPVDANGNLSGKAKEVNPPATATYSDKWFGNSPTTLCFMCPDGGATTDTAHYARCELRDLREWSYKDASTDEPYTLSVHTLPPLHKVVIGQAHDAVEPMLKVVAQNSGGKLMIYGLVKITDGSADTRTLIATGIDLGDTFTLAMSYTPAGLLGLKAAKLAVEVTTHDGIKHRAKWSMHRKGNGGKFYWKRGNYYQNAERKGFFCTVYHTR